MGFDVAPQADPRQMGMKRIAWSVETKGPDPQLVRREQWPQREATAREFIETCRSLYNIGGAVLASIGQVDYGDYASRVADLEGLRRAALAALTLRERKVAASDVPAALATSELRNPYDGQPFAWDGEAGAIFFRGLASGERGEHRISY